MAKPNVKKILLNIVSSLNTLLNKNTVTHITGNATSSTGTHVSSGAYRYGNVVHYAITFRNTSAVAAGSNIYVATISSNIPRPAQNAYGSTYYGAAVLTAVLNTSGVITIRNGGSSSVTIGGTNYAIVAITYITND